ncbi:DUF453-domain-containing protein [Aaosphaeria arxii CBS 175.79]|uniref:DUF453-domain-containing protein n=1 Tax=Aaosphaeria arxii CBS 175.79 TaxID=1450172 RepID=A0A6A5XVT6_9PLEO|nr:DUF453-domain-containing protein [Aaosphaeria arxii CBS 175.79]KAF2017056.1 DUF453-domain-containing protein [Aaosphaeria arxii CBS 175.79]
MRYLRGLRPKHCGQSIAIRSFSISVRSSGSSDQAMQRPIKAAYYRGGTSRALMINPRDLPKSRAEWPDIFRQIMGTPDPNGRQLDGMGAGISSLSKICLVEPFRKPVGEHKEDVFLDYTFVGVGIESDEVDVAGNCGNMSSAIAPYAYNSKELFPDQHRQKDGEVSVMIRNTNTGALIRSTFKVVGDQAAVQGNYAIDGVAGTASKIRLDFLHPYGSKTGKVLPTGNLIDQIAGFQVTCVDGANPAVFIRSEDVDVDGTILPNEFNRLPEKLAVLEKIRRRAAVAMGLTSTEDDVPRVIPKIGIVSRSKTHKVLSGEKVNGNDVDVVVRFISDGQPHRAIPLTMALTTAVAARIEGTIVYQLLAETLVADDAITIGHASGKIQVDATMSSDGKTPESATVLRTAKRIFEGDVFYTSNFETNSPTEGGNSSATELGLSFVNERRGQSLTSKPAE